MEKLDLNAAALGIIISLIVYIWVRLQRQIDKQQATLNSHETTIATLVAEKNGEYKLLIEKLSQQSDKITETKTDLKALTQVIYELKGSIQQNQHHNDKPI